MTNHGFMAMTLKPSPIIPMEASRRPETEECTSSSVKCEDLAHCFLDCNGEVHHELPQGRTVNKEYYIEVMSRLCEAIRPKRTKLLKNQSWILHHDNASSHKSMLVHEFLAKNKTVIMPQPLWPLLTFSSSQNSRH